MLRKIEPGFPREIADRIFWLNQCMGASLEEADYHLHLSLFLLVGTDKTLLVDTSTPTLWPQIEKQLEIALGGRTLDCLFITHPEVPHSAALPRFLEKFPSMRVVGDMRDYHLFYPEHVGRFHHHVAGDEIDLGELQFKFLDAHIKDLPGTLWGYESTRQVMFVCDGFSFTHLSQEKLDIIGLPLNRHDDEHDDLEDDPLHLPGECSLLSSELVGEVNVDQATYLLKRALYWSRFVNADKLFEEVDVLLGEYPTKLIAPSHGNVIDNLPKIGPVIRESHVQAYKSAMGGGL